MPRRTDQMPIIGFLSARFDEAYQNAVWKGAEAEAEARGAAIVFFEGQRIGSPIGFEAVDNVAFGMAECSALSGLVVMSNSIATYLSSAELSAFLCGFAPMPVVSVGIESPGLPSVSVDASGGMRAVAGHLVSAHGRRRLLFLAGPKGHPESEARLAEFLEAARELLPGGPEPAVLHGDFTDGDAREALAAFLDAGGEADAVAAANDLMAFGAMRALGERGIAVPSQVSVTGFDDTDDGRLSLPSLTTVRQPTEELGREAVRIIMASLEGPPGGPRARAATAPLRVSFVRRESCGCSFAPEPLGPECGEAEPPCDLPALAADIRAELARGGNPAIFRSRRFSAADRDKALLLVAEGESRFQAARRALAEDRSAVLRDIESSLVSSFALEDILSEVARGTRQLGISACWLALFDSSGPSPAWSRLLLASDEAGARILAPYGIRFRTADLLPGGLPRGRKSYVCEPLRFGADRLGYLVCTADSTDRRVYVALRDQVSSAIKGAKLMAAERDRERSLEKEVRIRTQELSASNSRLVEEMARRKRLERELLELSNSIMGRIGRDIHDDLCQDIAGLGLMAALMEGSLRRMGAADQAESAAALARAAGETAARAKGMARGLYPAELGARGIVAAVEDLARSARERGASVAVEVSRGFALRDPEKALQLYRIVQEALANAARHSRATEIKVGLFMDRESISVEVSDDGVGIPADAAGPGMGLRIMRYRASVVGGELRVRAKDRGTSVSCRIPR